MALQFASVERTVVVTVETVKQCRSRCLRFIDINGPVMVGIEGLQQAIAPACPECRWYSEQGTKDYRNADRHKGLFHVDFSRSSTARKGYVSNTEMHDMFRKMSACAYQPNVMTPCDGATRTTNSNFSDT